MPKKSSKKLSKKLSKKINKKNKNNKKNKEIKMNRELLNNVPKEYMNYKSIYGFIPIKSKNNSYEKNVATSGVIKNIDNISKILNFNF